VKLSEWLTAGMLITGLSVFAGCGGPDYDNPGVMVVDDAHAEQFPDDADDDDDDSR
jgi:hypothetical protein